MPVNRRQKHRLHNSCEGMHDDKADYEGILSVKSERILQYLGLGCAICGLSATPAMAQTNGPIAIGDGLTLDPVFDARLRYETVEQDNAVQDGNAVTLRVRTGIELGYEGFSILAESESNLAIVEDFNSTVNGNGGFGVIADPQTIELNRLQVQYANKDFGKVTLGRQRINLDDQRFVGAVAWRQNEQTFDAVRATVTALGPITFDGTYSTSQRTIFGADAGVREAFDGNFVFLDAGAKIGPVNIKAFSYSLDYNANEPLVGLSTQTFGALASAQFDLTERVSLAVRGRFATQRDFKSNPNDFSVEYIDAWAALNVSGITLAAGYEKLGADGNGNSFSTPLATLHQFNGFADLFLATPGNGLEDKYVTVKGKIPILGGVTAVATYHKFDSDVGGVSFGDEFDAVLSVDVKPFKLLFKYADYHADEFDVDTRRVWFQIDYVF